MPIAPSVAIVLVVAALTAASSVASPGAGVEESNREALAPTVTRSLHDGFDWGAAGVGAGAAIGLVLIAGAGLSLRGRLGAGDRPKTRRLT